MVRQATASDYPSIIEMGQRFHKMSPWSDMPFSKEVMVATLERMTDNDAAVIYVNGTGVIGGVVAAGMYFGGEKIAQELFWFADKDGIELLTAFEDWSEKKGASGVLMSAIPDDERPERIMNALFKRRKYSKTERTFYKGFSSHD